MGKEVLAKLGFTAREFEMVSWMCGWALCGHDVKAASREEEALRDKRAREAFPMFSREERVRAGMASKRLIDLGRAAWLAQEKGFRVALAKYAPTEITGENTLLLCKQQSQGSEQK